MRLQFLAGGMCEWHVRSNTPARQTVRICCTFSCLVLRGDTSGLELQALLSSLDFWLLFDQAKSKRKNICNPI